MMEHDHQPSEHGDHDHSDHDHSDGDHHHGEHGGHGHANDRGVSGMLRYLRFAPQMWRSSLNDTVIEVVDPQSGETVVDVGAGMGPGVMAAARRGASVIAVEPTPFLRTVLRGRRFLQKARKRITIVDGGVENLPIDSGSVHALWSVNAMHHWVNPEQGTLEIARVLRPGGRVVLIDEDFADTTHPDYERFQSAQDDDGHHHGFSMVDASKMGDWLRVAGLVEIEAEKRRMDGRPVIAVVGKAALGQAK